MKDILFMPGIESGFFDFSGFDALSAGKDRGGLSFNNGLYSLQIGLDEP